MKRYVYMIVMSLSIMTVTLPPTKATAQIPIVDIIKAAVKKVIQAIDLKVQQLQNKTIWLQNAQKELENKMAQLKLDEISDWSNKQKKLYSDYYEELKKVKATIATYQRVKQITRDQLQLVKEYKAAYELFKRDGNFSAGEISYMGQVYSGIISESIKNLDELLLAVNSFSTQMNDVQRLEIIERVARNISGNLADVRRFNSESKLLGLQRAREKNDLQSVQQLYGLPKN